ncbi:MAG: hypothetical protein Q9183_006054, partial [Haloplaca sp. 2 TL-2023]
MADSNPLIKALPPALDYISYLTLLEYNLTAEQLPTLHDILQDATLTANIGWDLVHLLLPLLPESQTCLQDVARLGNPREVVLKVTELLEALAVGDEDGEDEDEDGDVEKEGKEGKEEKGESTEESDAQTIKTTAEGSTSSQTQDNSNAEDKAGKKSKLPHVPPILRFTALIDMLTILHPRIKTKHPSRFLSTSLQAVLPAYATQAQHSEATESLLAFVKTFAGSKRPRLPPRKSSTQIPTQPQPAPASAPDPEGSNEPVAPEEDALQKRLLQSFLTFVVEGYLSLVPTDEEAVAMSWSSRLQEQSHPEKTIPGRKTMREAYEHDETLHNRDSVVGQMLALARDLSLSTTDYIHTITEPETPPNNDDDDDTLPSSPSEIPHSRLGCLYLLSATLASSSLFHAPSSLDILDLPLFPSYATILNNLLAASSSIGTEAPALIDSLLFLGLHILDTKGFGRPPQEDMVFTDTLRHLSLLSANTPSPTLRYHAHILTSRLLHAHPEGNVRLAFIKDTLEHCPYENLKGSAVGWLKEEIRIANASSTE